MTRVLYSVDIIPNGQPDIPRTITYVLFNIFLTNDTRGVTRNVQLPKNLVAGPQWWPRCNIDPVVPRGADGQCFKYSN